MQRRSFIKKASFATGTALALPYILPSGRLFAATGNRVVDHVVVCLFAGGVRTFESIDKAEGNLMPHLLSGNESINPQIAGSMSALPLPSGPRLQSLGTLYKEFRYAVGATGHFNAHAAVMTGNYNLVDVNLKQRPNNPTVFEYYRKHSNPTANALNAWWIANMLGPYPALNFSNYPGYGAMYGANFVQPASIISLEGYEVLGNPRNFSDAEKQKVSKIRAFATNSFGKDFEGGEAGVVNPEAEAQELNSFLSTSYAEAIAGQYNNPWNLPSQMSNDMFNVFFAEKIIRRFKPELLVVNMQDVDVCHTNFTQYCNNLRRADYAVHHLWQTIQSTPDMKDNTILLVVPEHGRNAVPNSVLDVNGRYAIDHTNDEVSRKIFCMVVGPPNKVKQNQVIENITGETIDVVPTVAHILGFKPEIPSGMLPGRVLNEAFV